jgi:hypothetical protein
MLEMIILKYNSLLVAESFVGGRISFVEDEGVSNKKSINSDTWEPLEKLYKGEVSI